MIEYGQVWRVKSEHRWVAMPVSRDRSGIWTCLVLGIDARSVPTPWLLTYSTLGSPDWERVA